jgi:serine/threonine-protein kinase
MSVTVRDFSRLLAQSQLFEPEACRQWLARYAKQHGLQPDAAAEGLAAWLVQSGALSAYQARVLMAGQPGPFVYGAYRVVDRVASGRLAGLFRAVHAATQHPVGLWFLSGPALADATTLAALQQICARACQAAGLQPQLARAWQLVDLGRFKFVVLEDLCGESLDEAAAAQAGLAPAEACRHVWHAAQAVAALHAAGLVHGDVRPGNILLLPQQRIKLLHFPLAPDPLAPPLHARIAQAAASGTALPEADYLSPEAALGQPLGPSADIYSLGCTLYKLLTGRVPFPGGSTQEKLSRHVQQMPQPLEQLVPGVPPALAQGVARMLAKQPQHRPASAMAVCEMLAPHLLSEHLQSSPGPSLPSLAAFQAAIAAESASGPSLGQLAGSAGQPQGLPPTPPTAAPRFVVGTAAAEPAGQQPAPPTPLPVSMPEAAASPAGAGAAAAGTPAAPSPLVDGQPSFPQVVPQTATTGGGPSSGLGRLSRKRDRSQVPVVIGSVAAAVAAMGAFAYFMSTADRSGPQPTATAAKTASGEEEGSSPGRTQAKRTVKPTPSDKQNAPPEAAEQGESPAVPPPPDTAAGVDDPLWELPRRSRPIDVQWLPPGPQLIVHLRPQRLLAHFEGEKLLDPRTLGPLAALLSEQVPKLTGLPLARLERLLVGVYDMSPEPVEVSLVAFAADELVLSDLLAAWNNPAQSEVQADGAAAPAWKGGGRAWWLPAGQSGRTVVSVPEKALAELIASGAGPVALRRQLELLLRSSDQDYELTVLAAPDFLFTGGKALLSGPAEKLKHPLDDFLTFRTDEGEFELPKAVMLSVSLDERLFIELRIDNSSSVRPSPILAREYREKVRSLSRRVNAYLRSLYLSPYSKEVLWDFPDRLAALGGMTTSGIDEHQVVLRAYLPAKAAHNLAMNTYLALLETPGAAPAVAATAGGNNTQPQLTVAQRLEKPMPLSFPRNTLERALEMVSEEIGVPIIILGTDLQVEGITKNQSFGMDEPEQPAREILRKILAKADQAGRLLYVIKRREEDGQQVLYVTTRAAAEKRQDPIPPEFVAKDQQPKKGGG